jgi:hypothetical protein
MTADTKLWEMILLQERIARIIEPTASGYTKEYTAALDKAAAILALPALRGEEIRARTPGTVEVCERHATGHDCSGEMDEETGRVDKPCSFYLCPLTAAPAPVTERQTKE